METLAKHTITSMRIGTVRSVYPRLHGKNSRLSYHGYGPTINAVELTTDLGAKGWGEYRGDLANIVGKNLSEVFDPNNGVTDEAYLPFDIALHDLAGVILGISVAEMLNKKAFAYAVVYDGAIYMNDIIPENRPQGIQAILRDCAHDYAQGYRIMKIKIGRGGKWMAPDEGLKRDIEVTNEVAAQHPDVRIMVDGNDAFTPETMIEYLKGVKCPIYWIEEPFREERSANQTLKEYLRFERPGTLIADGESRPDIPQLLSLGEEKLVDVIQPDIIGYGFTPWRKLLEECQRRGILASPHAWGNALKTIYCAHLAAAYPFHIPCVEGILGVTNGADVSAYGFENGIMHLPRASGFGVELEYLSESKP